MLGCDGFWCFHWKMGFRDLLKPQGMVPAKLTYDQSQIPRAVCEVVRVKVETRLVSIHNTLKDFEWYCKPFLQEPCKVKEHNSEVQNISCMKSCSEGPATTRQYSWFGLDWAESAVLSSLWVLRPGFHAKCNLNLLSMLFQPTKILLKESFQFLEKSFKNVFGKVTQTVKCWGHGSYLVSFCSFTHKNFLHVKAEQIEITIFSFSKKINCKFSP